ncbi:MAG TPA: acyloxyacyl hydrolase [Bacteroidales bacterium]|nr:acyloxyacyl hydrolase [Bacteroidales bacterium]
MNKNFFLLILITLSLSTYVCAQPRPPLPTNNYQLEYRQHYGFFYHHHLEFERFNAHFPSFELSFQRSTFGRQRWESLWAYPLTGVSVYYSPLGGFEPIGQVVALYPFISFPLNENVRSRLNFRLGVGLGYLTNKYHPSENFQNFAIGSHLNAAANIFLDYRQVVNKRITFVAGTGLTHFSNGSTKTPNYGLNAFSAAIGFNVFLNEPNPFLEMRFWPVLRPFEYDNKRWYAIEVMQAFGTRDMTMELGNRYLVSNTSVNWLVPNGIKSRFGAGIDFTYDDSERGMLDRRGAIEERKLYSNRLEIVKTGLSGIYEMRLSRMSFQFQLGVHLTGADKTDGEIFEKLGAKFYFSDPWFVNIALTAHGGRADFIGYGIGYRFDRIYYPRKKQRWNF